MGTISDKLTYLNTTKSNIKDSIELMGTTITSQDTFRSYADKIKNQLKTYLANDNIDIVWDNWVKIEEEGTFLTLNNTMEGKMSLILKGNTYQETTTGKNLFDGILELGNFNASTGEKVQNSNYIINTNPIPVEELTNYKISSNGTGIRMYVFEYKEDLSYNLSTRKTVNDNEYLTTNSGTKYINFRTIDVNTNLQEKIQVEKNSSATSYEKYTGGNPAPNPDYPQTISNVTGTNTIKIVGKNLFDKSNVNVLNAYFTANSPTITSSSSDRTIYIPCEPNTTYTISKNLVAYGRAVGYTSTIPAISSSVEGTINISANNVSGTITTGANANYLVMRAFNTGQDTLTYQQVLASIQVEKSSTATTYEAYKEKSYTINLGDIELCKIGDYKDRIYYSSGKWYLEKKINKVVLNGSENWQSYINAYNNLLTFRFNFADIKSANQIYLLSNYFKNVTDSDVANGEFRNRYNNYYNLEFVYTDITSVTDFKTWLSTHNTTVYYILNTPTTTEITDTTLVGQLDALNNARSYNVQTNISQSNDNEPAIINTTALENI